MKIRTDFVTNSSSSSYVIAKRNECTRKEIEDKLEELKSDIVYILELFDRDTSDSAVHDFISNLARGLYQIPDSLQLGEWTASGVEYSNEDSPAEAFMCDYGYKVNTDNFKVG